MKSIIFGFCLGVFGSFFGALFSHFFSESRRKKDVFNKGASQFRASFVDEMFRIRKIAKTPHRHWDERPEEIAIANEKAKIIFEAFLPSNQLAGFNAAWEQYKNPDQTKEKIFSPLNPENTKELVDIRMSHINKLLEFAKPK